MRDYDKIYVDGGWVPSAGSGSIEVINASTEEVMGHVPDGAPADVDAAVAAARAAFETWGFTPADERQKYIARLAEELGARSQELAHVRSCGVEVASDRLEIEA